jgi:hypothetical protein
VVAAVAGATPIAAAGVPSATAVVRLVISRATAQMRRAAVVEVEVEDADTVDVVPPIMGASAAKPKLATPAGVLDTSPGTVYKAASATTAAGRYVPPGPLASRALMRMM